MSGLRYCAAKDNPFEMSRVERLLSYDPGLVGTDWSRIESEWERRGRRGAVVGPHGSGKTSFLLGVANRLQQRGECFEAFFFNREQRIWSDEHRERVERAVRSQAVLLVDGYEQLSYWARRELDRETRNRTGIWVAAHRPTRFPTVLRTGTSVDGFRELVERLAPGEGWSHEELAPIFKQVDGNLREALWVCYDRCAGNRAG